MTFDTFLELLDKNANIFSFTIKIEWGFADKNGKSQYHQKEEIIILNAVFYRLIGMPA